MKRTPLAVLMIALALVALAAPLAYAQAPAPKVTITGLIDNLTSYASNVSTLDGILNRKDTVWYGRTRGVFTFTGEVGKAKGVFALETDMTYGQTGSNDSSIVNAGATSGTAVATQFGTNGGFDLNTDVRAVLELKWLYVEFPMPLIPVPTTVRIGAQPFGAAATYKLAAYATGDFAGVNLASQITPNLKLIGTYVQVDENLVGTGTRTGLTGTGNASTQNRGDDFAYIAAAEITPFKGLDIKPMVSMFYAQGTTAGPFGARNGRGGVALSDFANPAATTSGSSRGGINEYRYTVGLDSRLRMGPFSLDPTVMYQFGNRGVIAPAALAASGSVTGRKYYAELNAWLVDIRGGFQLGPLLLEAIVAYSTGNKARNNTLSNVNYYQPLDTDTGYQADWGSQLTGLGVDYLQAMNEGQVRVGYPGVTIGWDKYGRRQLGAKATYAITPELSVMAGASGHWTDEKVDRNGTAVAGAGIVPFFNAGPGQRDSSRYVGTELQGQLSWRFADGLTWDNAAGYMFAGPALDAITDPLAGGRNAKDAFILTSRVRFTF
jgi:hypothetical protein